MKTKFLSFFAIFFFFNSFAFADELFVFVNNSKKISNFCKNIRSLELSETLLTRYGTPNSLYSDTEVFKNPLELTSQITAKNINTEYVKGDQVALLGDILDKSNQNSTIFIAWNKEETFQIVKSIVETFDTKQVINTPEWKNDDIYVVRLFEVANKTFVTVATEAETIKNIECQKRSY